MIMKKIKSALVAAITVVVLLVIKIALVCIRLIGESLA